MGLNLSCQHKMCTPLFYIHSARTRLLAGRQARDSSTTLAGINSSIHMLKNSSAYSLLNLQTRQLNNPPSQKRENSSTHKRTTSPKTKRTTSAKTKLKNLSIRLFTNAQTHQPQNKQNSKTHQLVCSSTQELTNPRINKIQKLINSSAPHLKISSSKNLKIIIFILQAPSNFHVVLA